jgi:hypothetical protein
LNHFERRIEELEGKASLSAWAGGFASSVTTSLSSSVLTGRDEDNGKGVNEAS